MKPTVRVVSGGCLRSVELSGSSDKLWGSSACRLRVIDPLGLQPNRRETRVGRNSRNREVRPLAGRSPAGMGGRVEWVTNWARGSLGSLRAIPARQRLGDEASARSRAYDPRLDRDVAIKI